MAEDPSLFVHLPLNEVREGKLRDLGPKHLDATAERAHIGKDETFGSFVIGPEYVVLPPSIVIPEPFKPSGAIVTGAYPSKLTYTIWISPTPGEWESLLIDQGFSGDLQRLAVRVTRRSQRLAFSVEAPSTRSKNPGFCWTGEIEAPSTRWMHFALVWDPKGQAADAGYGTVRMFLNGGSLGNLVRTEAKRRTPRANEPPYEFQIVLGRPFFPGGCAAFRIYTRELQEREIAQQANQFLRRAQNLNPLKCELLDSHDRPMMPLRDSTRDAIAEKMTVLVEPLRYDLKLAALATAAAPDPERSHFEIRFRPDALNMSRGLDAVTTADGPGKWDAKLYPPTPQAQHVSLCIRCNFERPFSEDESLRIQLDSLMAESRFGPRWTRAELRYQKLIDHRGNSLSGSIPWWLQLGTRALRADPHPTPIAILLTDGWTQEPETAIRVISPNTFLQGRLVFADAQKLKTRADWKIVGRLPQGYAPWGKRDARFSGRVRWLEQPVPGRARALWCSDLIVAPTGTISMDGGPGSATRIEVSLNGVSYSSERSLFGAKVGEA